MLFVIIAMSVWDLKNGVSVSLWVDKANNDTGVYQAAGMATTPGTVFKSVNRPETEVDKSYKILSTYLVNI